MKAKSESEDAEARREVRAGLAQRGGLARLLRQAARHAEDQAKRVRQKFRAEEERLSGAFERLSVYLDVLAGEAVDPNTVKLVARTKDGQLVEVALDSLDGAADPLPAPKKRGIYSHKPECPCAWCVQAGRTVKKETA